MSTSDLNAHQEQPCLHAVLELAGLNTSDARDVTDFMSQVDWKKADELASVLRLTESPIERRFVMAIARSGFISGIAAGSPGCATIAHETGPILYLEAQRPIRDPAEDGEEFRLDFCLTAFSSLGAPCVNIGVEIDGHDFHEKTKEQVARDKRRDRAILTSGSVDAVMRFSGSEVHADARGCFAEVVSLAMRRAESLTAAFGEAISDAHDEGYAEGFAARGLAIVHMPEAAE